MRPHFLALTALLPAFATLAAPPKVETGDVARFWSTYDAVSTEPDAERRVTLVQERYIKPGSPGLHALMHARNYTASIRSLASFKPVSSSA